MSSEIKVDTISENTSANGVSIDSVTLKDGTITSTVADNSDNLTLISTDADANAGPNLRLYRNSSSPADHDIVGQIDFEGRNDNSEDIVYAKMFGSPKDVSDGTEDGGFFLHTMLAGSDVSRMGMSSSQTVFNDDGNDLDFRVEGNNFTSLLHVNAGDDSVYINNTIGEANTHDGYNERFGVTNANNVYNMYLDTTHASFSTYQIRGDTTRAADSNFGHVIYSTGNRADNQFRVMGDGSVHSDGSNNLGSGADYAEFFEWKDGNASDEDRRGYSVVLDGNQIVKATDSDDASKIIGVISGMPGVVGDTHWDRWHNKYLRDDYGSYIFEDYTQTEWKNDIGNVESYQTDLIPDDVTVPDDAVVTSKDENGNNLQRRKLNPSFDASKTYVPREDRKEWGIVGLVGKLRIKKGQPTGTNWIKMRDISDTVEEWLIR
jgi:hypothetical protein